MSQHPNRIRMRLALAIILTMLTAAFFVPAAAVAGGPSPLASVAEAGPETATSTITVVGEGAIERQADIAEAQIGVEIGRASAREATDDVRQIMDAVMAALREQGIAEKDIQTSYFGVSANRYGAEGPLPDDEIQYSVNSSMLVTIRDLESIGAVLDAAIDAGANSMYGITFRLDDVSALEADVQAAALANAKEKAARLAEFAGVQLGEIVGITEVVGGIFPPALGLEAAAPAYGGGVGPIAPGDISITQRLQVTYALRTSAAEADETLDAEGDATADAEDAQESAPSATETVAPEASAAETAVTRSSVNIIGGDEAQLRAFVEHWLSPAGYPGAPLTAWTLRLGSLPETLPVDLDLADMSVIGSIEMRSNVASTQIFLESTEPTADVMDAMEAQIKAQGFAGSEDEMVPYPGSVFAGPTSEMGRFLCKDEDDLTIYLTVIENADGLTDVRISVDETPYGSMCDSGSYENPALDIVPSLTSPAGSSVQETGSGYSNNEFSFESEIQSPLSIADIYQHYADQLAAAGFEQIGEQQIDKLAWSGWTVVDDKDKSWYVQFYVIDTGDPTVAQADAGDPQMTRAVATLRAGRQ